MKWAIRESVDVYFKAKSVFKLGARTIRKGEPVLIFDSVKTSTMEVATEMSYVTGGRGNVRILSYEGDKTLTFQFEDALLSTEGLAILAGADLIPARNKRLPGAAPEARSVISRHGETYAVVTPNMADTDPTNTYPSDASIPGKPRGGALNVWLSKKPYVGQNGSIYVWLLDDFGEMSGAPVEVNLKNDGVDNTQSYLATFKGAVAEPAAEGDSFVAFDHRGLPMSITDYPNPTTKDENGVFDDQTAHYVDFDSASANWVTAWGTISEFKRTISATSFGTGWAEAGFAYLLAPSGGVAHPKAFLEGSKIVYKVNIPSILNQDIVKLDYYVERLHDASQVSILPDKFAPFMYVEGSSLMRRASDGLDFPVEFVIPKFKITTALSLAFASTGDPSTFTFQGDAYPDFSKFDLTRKVLADIQILDADDNYDGVASDIVADPTSYRRYRYNEDTDGEYLWKDPSLPAHQNLDYSDAGYEPDEGGPATRTPGLGLIDTP